MFNPKEITDALSAYYSILYNLQTDTSTPKPTLELINTFLDSVSVPIVQQTDLETLNSPITTSEIRKII